MQKENFNAAIAAGADGIAASSPEIGALVEETQAALAAGIPVVFMDTDDKDTGRLAYVGADLHVLGTTWANYLIDNAGLAEGDFVWMPVEAVGAAYQVLETEAIASVFDPLGITYEVFDAGGDPATAQANMTDYLTANSADVDAIIGLGDLVMATIRPAFDAAGVAPGSIPVVGWGGTGETAQAVKDGYVNVAIWGYPDASGYDSDRPPEQGGERPVDRVRRPDPDPLRRVHRGHLHRADRRSESGRSGRRDRAPDRRGIGHSTQARCLGRVA